MSSQHYSVLLQESVDALITNTKGTYVDGTFGRGGHSREILKRLDVNGRLIAFDKDPEAIAVGNTLSESDNRFSIIHDSFATLGQIKTAVGEVDGVLLDLGVSSPQLDQAERGFSFLNDGPLDMRMNNAAGQTAAEWINSADEKDLIFVFREYGEERFAKRIANAIVREREREPFSSTLRFAHVVSEANPKWEKGKNPATRVFQAVRIFINKELDDLSAALEGGIEILKPGGRFSVISFHSLEDRMVKRFFRELARGKQFPAGMPVTEDMLDKQLKLIGRAHKAGKEELLENNRSRSAVLRIAEKL